MTQKRETPKDIRQYVRTRVAVRIVSCILLLVVIFGAMTLFDEFFFGKEGKPYRFQKQVVAYTVTFFVPFLVSGVPHKLMDSSFEGEVLQVMVHTSTVDKSILPSRESRYDKNVIELKLKNPNGDIEIRKVAELRADHRSMVDAYRVGDYVVHFYGTAHTVVLPRNEGDPIRCAVCGLNNGSDTETCIECGHSLIRRF